MMGEFCICDGSNTEFCPFHDTKKVKMSTLQKVLDSLAATVRIGGTTMDIETAAVALLNVLKLEPVFKGYQPDGHNKPYEFVTCISVNNEVIHGLPSDRKIEEGDVVKIDVGFKEDGLIYDGATTVLVGTPDKNNAEILRGTSAAARRLVKATREALAAGVKAAVAGKTNLTITEAIEAVARQYDLNIVVGYGGHGIGEKLHQEPFIANRAADAKGEPFKLESGMRIAIEPMFCTARADSFVTANGWTVKVPAGLAAHFERTITIK